ncbi:MAG: bacillithiol biosynthesis deacetylase BshB1, partial [Candidatus Dadabacteria bacterium]
TQFFSRDNDGPQTYISSPDFFDALTARARLIGKRIGVKYGEGFISKKNIGIHNLDSLILNET